MKAVNLNTASRVSPLLKRTQCQCSFLDFVQKASYEVVKLSKGK